MVVVLVVELYCTFVLFVSRERDSDSSTDNGTVPFIASVAEDGSDGMAYCDESLEGDLY